MTDINSDTVTPITQGSSISCIRPYSPITFHLHVLATFSIDVSTRQAVLAIPRGPISCQKCTVTADVNIFNHGEKVKMWVFSTLFDISQLLFLFASFDTFKLFRTCTLLTVVVFCQFMFCLTSKGQHKAKLKGRKWKCVGGGGWGGEGKSHC